MPNKFYYFFSIGYKNIIGNASECLWFFDTQTLISTRQKTGTRLGAIESTEISIRY
jgi:hypothetical protein